MKIQCGICQRVYNSKDIILRVRQSDYLQHTRPLCKKCFDREIKGDEE